MALILAIQPDEQQAAILSGVVMNQLRADLVLVDSKEAALARIRKQVPDLILLAAELGRPDDEEFAGRLRRIKDAEHLRTLSMPSLGSVDDSVEQASGGLLRAFKRKRGETRRRGRDPRQFAKELRTYLKRAERLKADRRSASDAAPAPTADVQATREGAQPAAPHAPEATAEVQAAAKEAATTVTPDRRPVLLPSAAAPTVTLESIEMRVTAAARAIDTAEIRSESDVRAIIDALRVPPRVAGFSYPGGCHIGRIRLSKHVKSRSAWRPIHEPPPCGTRTRTQPAGH